jgi:hypothetical protein
MTLDRVSMPMIASIAIPARANSPTIHPLTEYAERMIPLGRFIENRLDRQYVECHFWL